MTKSELQKLAVTRLEEAEILLDNGYYNGACYLVGYAIESALKACIAEQFQHHKIPDKNFVNNIYTHDFDKLLYHAELNVVLSKQIEVDSDLYRNWSILKEWSIDYRYMTRTKEERARNLVQAVADKDNGILNWIREQW